MNTTRFFLHASKAFSVVAVCSFAASEMLAGIMSTDVDQVVYTDFGQNMGRYKVGVTNALTQHLNTQGVYICYNSGNAPFKLEGGAVDFRNSTDNAMTTLISENFVATASHNNLGMQTFSTAEVGAGKAIYYSLIETQNSNWHVPGNGADYKVTRLSKVVTDASAVTSYVGGADKLVGQLMYRAGSGTMQKGSVSAGSDYVAGGIVNIAGVETKSNVFKYTSDLFKDRNNLNSNPLPYYSQQGDSGSPSYIWNADAKQYEFVATLQGETAQGSNTSQNMGWGDNTGWGTGVADSYDVHVDMSTDASIMIHAPEAPVNGSSAYSGWIQMDKYENVVSYKGVKTNKSNWENPGYTWQSLTAEKDKDNWYAYYSGSYLVSNYQTTLFDTQNLVFTSKNAENTITLGGEDVDLGVGYAEFRAAGDAAGIVKYTITDGTLGGNTQFNHAGYVVGNGVEVHLQIKNSVENYYTREWRKIGEGDLFIEGNGDNDVLLNLGGTGKTYLQQTGGYAAYNVLVNTGSVVVIKDIGQIERDLTFGAGGGTLDMNGNSMNWYTTSETTTDDYSNSNRAGFSVKALTEEAVIANYAKDTTSTLTYKEAGTFLGSFKDSAESALKVVYDGNGTWTLNSIQTHLQNKDSGLQVNNGTVVLAGTLTKHAAGSAVGATSASQVYTNENDWHYADAKMNVSVESGATFELGSHARLTGDVTVKSGGTYTMREGVKHAQEYIEGGYVLESTAAISDYYGHKGNTSLAKDATLEVKFSNGVTANTTYTGNISGEGNMSVDLGNAGGSLTLTGTNTFTGTKNVVSGMLIFEDLAAMGDTAQNKWTVVKGATISWMDSNVSANEFLSHIDTSSSKEITLALGSDHKGSQLSGMTIGALEGKTIQYGTAGTSDNLTATNGSWKLGGGGGTLMVNYLLDGDSNTALSVGRGTVVAANKMSKFSSVILESAESVFAVNSADLSDFSVKGEHGGKIGVMLTNNGSDIIKAAKGFSGNLQVLSGTLKLESPHEWESVAAVELNDGVKAVSTAGGTFAKQVVLNGAVEFGIAGGKEFKMSGAISGTGTLIHNDTGTLVLDGAVSLSQLTVNAGTIKLKTGDFNSLTIVGGSGKLEISDDVKLSDSMMLVVGETDIKDALISGSGTLNLGDNKIEITKAEQRALSLAAKTAYTSQYQYQIVDANSKADDSWTASDFVLVGWNGASVLSYENGLLTIAIPEPSAFGVLAGLGALALCASRRRRKV